MSSGELIHAKTESVHIDVSTHDGTDLVIEHPIDLQKLPQPVGDGSAFTPERSVLAVEEPRGSISPTPREMATVEGHEVIVFTNPAQSQAVTTLSEVASNTEHGESTTIIEVQSIGTNPTEKVADESVQACQVCCDRGSGYHYSVYSCEGCKGFFKRTIQKNLTYVCKENQECVINKYTRNSCQYCRFQKCTIAGMKKEAVREDRTPGGKHRHKRMRTEEGASNVPTLENIIASTAPDTYNNELVRQLVEANPGEIPNFDCSHLQGDGPIHVDVNDLVQYGYSELRLIIEWARKVPGFLELLLEDQMALLKGSFMELNVLRLAFRSMETGGKVRLAEGLMLSPEKSIDIGWGKDLIMATQEFITRLQCISMDMTEFCILNAVVLTYPDAVGIQDKNAVSQLQGKILDSLRRYTTSTYPNMPRRYSKMLLRLPSLRTVSAKAAERFLNMTLDGSIKVNSLVLDMMT